MKPTRKQQPYRQSGSRGASQTLDAMQRGGMVGSGNALMRASQAVRGPGKRKGVSVPRVEPYHKRVR